MAKMKPRTWDQRNRSEKHSAVLWPGQTDKDTQSEMAAISKGQEGKPLQNSHCSAIKNVARVAHSGEGRNLNESLAYRGRSAPA